MAMLVSETSGATRASSGWNTQPAAVRTNTTATAVSPRLNGPRRARSPAISSRMPGISPGSSRNDTRVSSRYTTGSVTRTTGTPSSIQRPNPSSNPYWLLT